MTQETLSTAKFLDSRKAFFQNQPITCNIPHAVAINALFGPSNVVSSNSVIMIGKRQLPEELWRLIVVKAIDYNKDTILKHTVFDYIQRMRPLKLDCHSLYATCQSITYEIIKYSPCLTVSSLPTVHRAGFPLQQAILAQDLDPDNRFQALRFFANSSSSIAFAPLLSTDLLVHCNSLNSFRCLITKVQSIDVIIDITRKNRHAINCIVDAAKSFTYMPSLFSQPNVRQIVCNTNIHISVRACMVSLLADDTSNLSIRFSVDATTVEITELMSAILKRFRFPVFNRYNIYDIFSILHTNHRTCHALTLDTVSALIATSLLAQPGALQCKLSYIRALFSLVHDDLSDINRVLCSPFASAIRSASDIIHKIDTLSRNPYIQKGLRTGLIALSHAVTSMLSCRNKPLHEILIAYTKPFTIPHTICTKCSVSPSFH